MKFNLNREIYELSIITYIYTKMQRNNSNSSHGSLKLINYNEIDEVTSLKDYKTSSRRDLF
jgi:hypothetical protein